MMWIVNAERANSSLKIYQWSNSFGNSAALKLIEIAQYHYETSYIVSFYVNWNFETLQLIQGSLTIR